jgi:hypothetical protein
LEVSLCDLSWSGYSVPEAVRNGKFSFILQAGNLRKFVLQDPHLPAP